MSLAVHRTIRIFGLASLAALLLAGCGAAPGPDAAPAPAAQSRAPTPPPDAAAQNLAPAPPQTTVALPESAQGAPAIPTANKPTDCPRLASSLYQIAQAPDPAGQARQAGLRVERGKIQVVLIVSGDDVQLDPSFGVEVGSRAGQQIQALAPLDQLCALARADGVLAIRPPAQGIPH